MCQDMHPAYGALLGPLYTKPLPTAAQSIIIHSNLDTIGLSSVVPVRTSHIDYIQASDKGYCHQKPPLIR